MMRFSCFPGAVSVVDGAADVVDDRVRQERAQARRAAIRDITVQRYMQADAEEAGNQDAMGMSNAAAVAASAAGPAAAPVSFKLGMKKRKM